MIGLMWGQMRRGEKGRFGRLRNKVAWRMFKVSLAVAEPEYRNFIEGSVHYGLSALIRDVEQDIEPPKDWTQHEAMKNMRWMQ